MGERRDIQDEMPADCEDIATPISFAEEEAVKLFRAALVILCSKYDIVMFSNTDINIVSANGDVWVRIRKVSKDGEKQEQ